jgi:membrane-associated phospholipid phosphatase
VNLARPYLILVLFLSSLFALSANARADETNDVAWKDQWPTFRPLEYVATGAAAVAATWVFFEVPLQSEPHWVGGILFDDAVRDAIRLRSPGARDAVRTATDYMAVSAVAFTVGIDSLVVPLARGKSKVALQMLLMDAESLAFSSLVTTSLYKTVGRARPSYEDCLRNPNFDSLCNSGTTASFPSGHSSEAFTGAGLSCAHHAYLSLFGSPAADALACAGEITLAATTATFRVMGDRHYATDVLTGGTIGFLFGYGMPTLLHYGLHRAPPAMLVVSPIGDRSTWGLSAAGVF